MKVLGQKYLIVADVVNDVSNYMSMTLHTSLWQKTVNEKIKQIDLLFSSVTTQNKVLQK